MVAALPEAVRAPAAVTGLGLVSALGYGVPETWRRLLAGDSAVAVLPEDAFALPVKLPVRLAARLDPDALAAHIRAAVPRSVWNTAAPVCHAWLLAALEALTDAGLLGETGWAPDGPDPARVGVYVGNGGGAPGFTEQEYVNVYTAEKAVHRDVSRMAIPKYMASSLAAQLAIHAGLRGPTMVLNTACSSGATALATALDALRLGRIDAAVVGGADLPVTAGTLKGFANLGALTGRHELGERACRPFAPDREGFVLGEGAACLVLERPEAAAGRGHPARALLRGAALSSEAHHLLSPQPDGAGMAPCINAALADAALAPDAVAHVYAHGTGTAYNDQYEAEALRGVLPHGPTVSATKAQVGHTLGAAGALDAVLAVRSLETHQVVPLALDGAPAPECPILPAPAGEHPRLAADATAAVLVNAFAFGGHNACLVLSRPDPDSTAQPTP